MGSGRERADRGVRRPIRARAAALSGRGIGRAAAEGGVTDGGSSQWKGGSEVTTRLFHQSQSAPANGRGQR